MKKCSPEQRMKKKATTTTTSKVAHAEKIKALTSNSKKPQKSNISGSWFNQFKQ